MFYNCITKHKTAKPKYPKSWISFGSGFLVTSSRQVMSSTLPLSLGGVTLNLLKKGQSRLKKNPMDWAYTIWIKKISKKLFYYQDQYHYQDRWCNKLDSTSRIQQFSPAFHAYFQFRARTRLVLRIFGLIPSLTKKDTVGSRPGLRPSRKQGLIFHYLAYWSDFGSFCSLVLPYPG